MKRGTTVGRLARDGRVVRYWIAGDGARPAVVLTHGAGLDRRVFAPQVAALAARYHVISWDLPGHGESVPAGSRLSIRRMVDDLVALLDDLGVEQAVLVGHSMGGDLVQETVFRHPDRAAALVVISSVRLFDPRGLRESLLARLRPWKIRLTSVERFREATAAGVTGDPEVRAYVLECLRRRSAGETAALWSAIARAPHAEPTYRFPCPLLTIVGAEDRLGDGFIPRAARLWVEQEREATLAVIPGAGHLPTLDRPDAVNEALLAFLGRLSGGHSAGSVSGGSSGSSSP